MPQPDALSVAIDQLYVAFAGVPRPTAIRCPPDWDEAVPALPYYQGASLRRIPREMLDTYAFAAPIAVGSSDDFRYFLPRIVEISCSVRFESVDLDIIFRRLDTAGWHTWPAEQQRAVRGVARALWTHTMTVYPSGVHIDIPVVLCAIGAVEGLASYLSRWATVLHRFPAAARLHELLESGLDHDADGYRLTNSEGQSPGRHIECQVITWLTGAELRQSVATALTAALDAETRHILGDIGERLNVGPPRKPPTPRTGCHQR